METNSLQELEDTMEYEAESAIGSVQIADDVVAMIAGLAATEVDGVVMNTGSQGGEAPGRSAARKMLKHVKVDVAGENVSVDINIAIAYGHQIPQTCQNVQTKVKSAIETMTGLSVSDVNVRVVKVNMQ